MAATRQDRDAGRTGLEGRRVRQFIAAPDFERCLDEILDADLSDIEVVSEDDDWHPELEVLGNHELEDISEGEEDSISDMEVSDNDTEVAATEKGSDEDDNYEDIGKAGTSSGKSTSRNTKKGTKKKKTNKSVKKGKPIAKSIWPERKNKKAFITKDTTFLAQTIHDEADELCSDKSPFQYFSEYLPPSVIEEIAFQTNLYALQKTGNNISTTKNEIQCFIGIHVHMGSLGFPRCRMYWSSSNRIPLIADHMTFNRFSKLRSLVHFADTESHDKNSQDRLWKIRLFTEAFRDKCKSLQAEQNCCVDEQMLPFKGRVSFKQYIKNKPVKWGVKIFMLCGESGLVLDFLVYQGKTTPIAKELLATFGLGASVVLHLSERLPKQMNHVLFFDNFFTSIDIFGELSLSGILAAGTIRKDRTKNCPLMSDKMLAATGRGSCDEVSDNDDNLVVVKWIDNKPVLLASSFVGIGKQDEVQRWSKTDKDFITVKRPEVVKLYNSSMGGVDKVDFLMSLYRISIRCKKWTVKAFFHFVDLVIVNSWLEYLKDSSILGVAKNKQLDLLDFRHEIALALIKMANVKVARIGRPPNAAQQQDSPTTGKKRKIRSHSTIVISQDARFDCTGHWPVHKEMKNPAFCKIKNCPGRSRVYCEKCQVFLCLTKTRNCFKSFHIK